MSMRWLSQVFLADKNILRKEAEQIEPEAKRVIEIGGGLGQLSEELMKLKPKKLWIVEYDRNLAKTLAAKLSPNKEVAVINQDFLETEPGQFGKVEIICGNIPYHITSKIIFRLLDYEFKKGYMLMQKEVVDKIIDHFNDCWYSRLNIMANYYFECEKGMVVPRTCFRPIPNVDSQVLILRKRRIPRNPSFEKFIRLVFQHQKRTLRNALLDSRAEMLIGSEEELRELIKKLRYHEERVFHMNLAMLIITWKELVELKAIENNLNAPQKKTRKKQYKQSLRKKVCDRSTD